VVLAQLHARPTAVLTAWYGRGSAKVKQALAASKEKEAAANGSGKKGLAGAAAATASAASASADDPSPIGEIPERRKAQLLSLNAEETCDVIDHQVCVPTFSRFCSSIRL
jgi:hypothetical protein